MAEDGVAAADEDEDADKGEDEDDANNGDSDGGTGSMARVAGRSVGEWGWSDTCATPALTKKVRVAYISALPMSAHATQRAGLLSTAPAANASKEV